MYQSLCGFLFLDALGGRGKIGQLLSSNEAGHRSNPRSAAKSGVPRRLSLLSAASGASKASIRRNRRDYIAERFGRRSAVEDLVLLEASSIEPARADF